MIKANELRIGNKVQDDSGYILVNAFLLTELEANVADIDPIPLTPEILEKAGFKDQKYYEWEAFAYKDTPICAFFDGVEWCFKYGYDADLVFASCKYVHSLQNLIFVLTGEELSINL